MLGAIAGDIIGSAYERHNVNTYDFELFAEHSRCTDDSVMTVAVADALMARTDIADSLRLWAGRYPHAGYGPGFLSWLGGSGYCGSRGNGAAIRVSPIGWAAHNLDACLALAEAQARILHDTPEGVAGALAVATAVFLARRRGTKEGIAEAVMRVAPGYDLAWPPQPKPGPLARESCPAAISAFLASVDFEDAVRKAVSLGGDSDSVASMAGAIAEAFYGGVPGHIEAEVVKLLPDDMLAVLKGFQMWVAKSAA